jgi:hypothetical protein
VTGVQTCALPIFSKQGNSMVRHLLVEAAQASSKFDPELRRDYEHAIRNEIIQA